MRKYIPILNPIPQPTKPTTLKRWDAVFTALSLLLQLSGYTFGTKLVGFLNNYFIRITNSLIGDAATLSAGITNARLFWINYLRSNLDVARSLLPGDYQHPRSAYTLLLDIVNFRESIKDSIERDHLLLFDRVVFALLSINRTMSFSSPPNWNTITDAWEYTEVTDADTGAVSRVPVKDPKIPTLDNCPECLRELGITPDEFKAEYNRRAAALKHTIRGTAGPNGPSTWTAHSDARVIMGNTRLWTTMLSFAEQAGLSRFMSDLLGTVSLPNHDGKPDALLVPGRLHTFEEWGGKVRIVAILDYWTQLLLTPLHDTIFHFLRRLESDGTFNQDRLAETVRLWTADPETPLHSLDLTAATDRLPISLQEDVLGILMGTQFATLWSKLLVGREYHRESGQPIKYAVGQPMGARSSWAMLALTHHAIVQSAALDCKKTGYRHYAILGDDVVIGGTEVATKYKAIMEALRVNISIEKSIEPILNCVNSAEIAKRVFINGNEISSIPVKLLAKTAMNGRLAPQLQNHVTQRGLGGLGTPLLTWLLAIIDSESGEFMSILNAIPTYLSGLTTQLQPKELQSALSSWYSGQKVTENDLIQAYLFVSITEQLNRLDTLLRQTQIITAAIESSAYGYHTQQIGHLGWKEIDPEHDIESLKQGMPKLNVTHPIVHAAMAEVDRIGDLLMRVRTGDPEIIRAARFELLDMFRNSLVDAWSDPEAIRGQADRSLVQRAFYTLNDVVFNRLDKDSLHRIDFSVSLAYLNRLWTVTWTLGHQVQINAVKSRVIGSATGATTHATDIYKTVNPTTMFKVHPRRASKRAPQVTRPGSTSSKNSPGWRG